MEITREEYMQVVTAMIQGICANPASGNIANDSYAKQYLITSVLQDVGQGLANQGISIIEPTGED